MKFDVSHGKGSVVSDISSTTRKNHHLPNTVLLFSVCGFGDAAHDIRGNRGYL